MFKIKLLYKCGYNNEIKGATAEVDLHIHFLHRRVCLKI